MHPSPDDFSSLYVIAVVALSSLALAAVPMLRRPGYYTGTACIASIFVYRSATPGYLLLILLLYGALLCIDYMTKQNQRRRSAIDKAAQRGAVAFRPLVEVEEPAVPDYDRAARWRYSAALMFCAVGLFLIGTWRVPNGVPVHFARVHWTLHVGDMWFLLRVLSFVWEYGSGQSELETVPYFTWMIFPCTAYGPLLRFKDFRAQFSNLGKVMPTSVVTRAGWRLLALGLGQRICGLIIRAFAAWTIQAYPHVRLWKVVDAFGAGPWGFYFAGAGTFHLMEYFALFWGLSLPPSFQKPFGQPNIAEFWKRWNMSATSFFRDHFFFNRWGLKRANLYLNSLILFIFMGLWHSVNWYWAIFGLLHGTGFCVFMWWRNHRNQLLISKKLSLSPVASRIIAGVVTYVFVCLCSAAPSKIIVALRGR
jgi:D-alanyl-lipoteichoic acid acyltransferase DltB (MBOAT superfamily)